MKTRSRNNSALRRAATLLALGFGLAAPAGASANHHLVSISEVYAGTAAEPTREFVELKLYANGQNVFAPNSRLDFYSPSGVVIGQVPIGSVANGSSQRTVLIGTALNSVPPDTVFAPTGLSDGFISQAGGAVCFESTSFARIDCVSWGSISSPPTGSAPPAAAMTDLKSLTRSTAPGCSTLLEAGDDTDSSATDFFLATPSPQNNATAVSSTCMELNPPETDLTKMPRARSTDRTPTFRFSSDDPSAAFRCQYDGGSFGPCASPESKRLKLGRHTFAVKAVAGNLEDVSPATYSWKIVRR